MVLIVRYVMFFSISVSRIVVIGTESTKGNANSKEFWQGVYLIYKGLSYARNLVRLRIFQ